MTEELPAYQSRPGEYPESTGPARRSAIAIASLVLGVLAIPLTLTIYLGLLVGALAVGFSIGGLVITRGGRAGGRGMAWAGLITGLIGLIMSASLFAAAVKTIRDCEERIGHRPTTEELRECVETGV